MYKSFSTISFLDFIRTGFFIIFKLMTFLSEILAAVPSKEAEYFAFANIKSISIN